MRSSDNQTPDKFPDLTLPERTDAETGAAGPAGPSNPHIQVAARDDKIQTPAEAEDLRRLLTRPPPTAGKRAAAVPKMVAFVLAFQGVGCGLFMLPQIIAFNPLHWLLLAPFLLLTVAYFVRLIADPPLGVRRLLWLGSLIVNALWMSYGLLIMATMRAAPSARYFVAWWTFATLASVCALRKEAPDAVVQANRMSTATQELIVIGLIILLLIAGATIFTVFAVVRFG